ncbi:MAG: hypothetical protein R2880_06570 [Deinococcales bacterium]
MKDILKNEKSLGLMLLAIGILALVSRIEGDTGWLWVAAISGAFLFAYSRFRQYGFLVAGCIIGGVAAGIILETIFRTEGIFLLGLGAGFIAIDRVRPLPSRWPLYPGGILIAIGLMIGLSQMFGSFLFALMMIAIGLFFLFKDKRVNFNMTVDIDDSANPRTKTASTMTSKKVPLEPKTVELAKAASLDLTEESNRSQANSSEVRLEDDSQREPSVGSAYPKQQAKLD